MEFIEVAGAYHRNLVILLIRSKSNTDPQILIAGSHRNDYNSVSINPRSPTDLPVPFPAVNLPKETKSFNLTCHFLYVIRVVQWCFL